MSVGRVVAIYIGPEPQGPVRRVDEVNAVAGRGLEGDRYFQPAPGGTPDRNVVTAGVRLDELVGRTFALGEVEVEAIEPNPPCSHLQKLAGKPLLKPLARRGGVRGRIVKGGVLRAGDPVSAATP